MSAMLPLTLTRYIIPEPVLRTIATLKKHRYQAWLVGGSVRDMICGRTPKDFDITTDARPWQICELFRRSRVVGRRFPVVHVFCGNHLMEISTFRRLPDDKSPATQSAHKKRRSHRNHDYGNNVHHDALRRDYTINSIYYDPIDKCIQDHLCARQDIQERRIRAIGEPSIRLSEDPARMLRALYFSAKLGFEIEPELAQTIKTHAHQILAISTGRLNHDLDKMFASGHSAAIWDLLHEYGFVQYLLPALSNTLRDQKYQHVFEFTKHVFEQTDHRVAQKQSVSLEFLLAALLWYPLQVRAFGINEQPIREDTLKKTRNAITSYGSGILNAQHKISAILFRQRRFINNVWHMQPRLIAVAMKNNAQLASRLYEESEFRSGLQLLRMRMVAEPHLKPYIQVWDNLNKTMSAKYNAPQRSHSQRNAGGTEKTLKSLGKRHKRHTKVS